MVTAGLICSVTRSAWLGTAAAITVLAVVMGQKKRFALYATLALALFAASVPALGLSDYFFYNRTGQDPSAESHRDSILTGLEYVGAHPLGGGNANIGPRPGMEVGNALIVETTYLAFAAEYGILAALCFLGFMFAAFRLAWRDQSSSGYAAVGVLIGIGLMMTVLLMHDDRRLVCWAWFPIGLAVQSSIGRGVPTIGALPETLRRTA
jgi:O-antigen ligase